jgi:hypothetical protein
MERSHVEKTQAKQEADYAFDPIAATPETWKSYLLNSKNFEKDFSQGEYPFQTPASTILKRYRDVGSPRAVIEIAVQTVLDNWDEIVGQKSSFREINPITFVATLADSASVDIVQRLWTHAPQTSTMLHKGLQYVAEGLGEQVPLGNEALELLYIDQFGLFSFTALEILLKRGEVKRASELFEQCVNKYPKGFDPVVFDYLVALGLPLSSAKKWLDQSANAGPGYESHYQDALTRWSYNHADQ